MTFKHSTRSSGALRRTLTRWLLGEDTETLIARLMAEREAALRAATEAEARTEAVIKRGASMIGTMIDSLAREIDRTTQDAHFRIARVAAHARTEAEIAERTRVAG